MGATLEMVRDRDQEACLMFGEAASCPSSYEAICTLFPCDVMKCIEDDQAWAETIAFIRDAMA